MCRWGYKYNDDGCVYNDTTFMCRFCGTRFCNECLRGEFSGLMKEAGHCKVCKQPSCVGKRVEYVPGKGPSEEAIRRFERKIGKKKGK